MMVRLPRTSLFALFALLALLALLALPATAQTPGLPVYGGGFAGGVELSATVGFPQAESRTGSGTTYGATGTFAFGRVGIAGTVARFDADGGEGRWAYGAQVGVKLIGAPLAPLAVYAVGGIGAAEDEDPNADTQFIPLALAATLTIPTPILAVKPWLAPRLDIERSSFQGSASSNELFGLSAGVDLTLLSGLSFRASYDYVKNYDPFVAFGAAFHF